MEKTSKMTKQSVNLIPTHVPIIEQMESTVKHVAIMPR